MKITKDDLLERLRNVHDEPSLEDRYYKVARMLGRYIDDPEIGDILEGLGLGSFYVAPVP